MVRVDKGLDGRGIWRAVYTSIWDDPDFRKFPPNAKLVLLNLRTNPFSNIPVLYPLYLEPIKLQTGLGVKSIQKAIRTLIDAGWIQVEDGLVWVKKGLRFDPNVTLNNEKHAISIRNIILSLPKSPIVRDFIDYYKIQIAYPIPSRIGYAIAHTIQDTDTDTKEDTKEEEEQEPEEEGKPKTLSLSTGKGKNQSKKWIDPNAMTPDEKAARYQSCEAEKKRQLKQADEMGVKRD